MPKCKNNPSRFYKGTEPSPKGFGYCASGAKVGTRKRGKDGKMWYVKKMKQSRRWVRVVLKNKPRNKQNKLKKKSKKQNFINLRLVFGVYKTNKTDKLTDTQIQKVFQSAKPYNRINNSTDYAMELILKASNINHVKVCRPPQIKTLGIFKGWLHSPDKVVVVDIKGIFRPSKGGSVRMVRLVTFAFPLV